MPWFYVDDGFSDSKPVLNLPARHRLAACGLWVLAGSWSAKEETDGRVPEAKLKQLGARPALIDALTTDSEFGTPLWSRVGREVQFNSWSKWQKTRAELQKVRAENAERQRATRIRKRKGRNAVISDDPEVSQCDSQRDTEDCHAVTHAVVTRDPHARARRPDPTRPDPKENYSPNEESSPNVGGDERGLPEAVNPSASRLVSALIPDSIPSAVRTGLRHRASELINRDGLDSDAVAESLRRWLARPGAGVGLLPSLASDVIRERASPATQPASKLRAVASLAARQRATENAAREELE